MNLTVLIPVYNEARTAPVLLRRLLQTPTPPGVEQRRVIVVDDASTDGTNTAITEALGRSHVGDAVTVLKHEHNQGKGAAVRTALAAALAQSPAPDVVLIQDADLEYDPRDHAKVLAPIIDGRADAVIGSRFGGEAHRVLYFWHYKANRFITLCSNMLTNLNLNDVECCLKAMTTDVARQITIREDRFGIEPELVAKIARTRLPDDGSMGGVITGRATPSGGATGLRRARVFEVAVSYAGRTYAEGKKIRPRDGMRALWCILKYNLLSR